MRTAAGDVQPVIQEAIDEFDPEVIGVSATSIDDQLMDSTHFMLDQAKAVGALCRKLSQATIVIGGSGCGGRRSSSR